MEIRMLGDSNHAGDQLVRRSRPGSFVYVNLSLVVWLSKKQGTIEISVFGVKFMAMILRMAPLEAILLM